MHIHEGDFGAQPPGNQFERLAYGLQGFTGTIDGNHDVGIHGVLLVIVVGVQEIPL